MRASSAGQITAGATRRVAPEDVLDGEARLAPDLFRLHAWMVVLVVTTGLGSLFFAEVIPLSEGFGWEGAMYGAMARDFFAIVFERGIDPYLAHRILPSAVVHYALRAIRAPLDNPTVILGFKIWNLALLTLCAILWKPISDALALGRTARIVGFLGLFISYAVLKHAWYLPVMTDVSAFAIGTTAVWLYLTRRSVALALLAIVGAFAWPVTAPSLAPLVLFPRRSSPLPENRESTLATIAATGLAVMLALGFVYMFAIRGIRAVGLGPTTPVVTALVIPSLAVYVAHIIVVVRGLTGGVDMAYLIRALRSLELRNIVLTLLVLLLPSVLIGLLPAAPEGTLDARAFGRYIIFLPNTRPYVFMLAHVVFFGPVLLLLYFTWRQFCDVARAEGAGVVLFLLLALVVSLTPESRQSSLAIPLVMALTASAINRFRLRNRTLAFLAFCSLLACKIWLSINAINTEADIVHDVGVRLRGYFLSNGPWMTNFWYALQATIVLAIGLVLFRMLRADAARALLPSSSVR